jgi:hypothetical protein
MWVEIPGQRVTLQKLLDLAGVEYNPEAEYRVKNERLTTLTDTVTSGKTLIVLKPEWRCSDLPPDEHAAFHREMKVESSDDFMDLGEALERVCDLARTAIDYLVALNMDEDKKDRLALGIVKDFIVNRFGEE